MIFDNNSLSFVWAVYRGNRVLEFSLFIFMNLLALTLVFCLKWDSEKSMGNRYADQRNLPVGRDIFGKWMVEHRKQIQSLARIPTETRCRLVSFHEIGG